MKKLIIAVSSLVICFSCSKRALPSKTVTTPVDTISVANPGDNIYVDSAGVKIDSAAAIMNVMVIADGYGRLITPKRNLPPDAGVNYNDLQLSKGFTTQQRANLQARYNTIPPRVLFVPQQQILNSLKGSYYVYKKKFWYWKRSDGLFYLDQKYYL